MKIATDLDKLQKKIEKEKQYKRELYNERSSGCLFIDPKKEKPKENSAREKLDFLLRLSNMVKKGATGFDLAYEVEKNQEVKSLIYDGVLFYNTFLEIGTQKFIDVPDKQTKNYKSFKTVEDTEKYLFIVWLNDTISSLQKQISLKEDYTKFVEVKVAKEREEAEKRLIAQLTHCKKCGAKISDSRQVVCEECGENLKEQLTNKKLGSLL